MGYLKVLYFHYSAFFFIRLETKFKMPFSLILQVMFEGIRGRSYTGYIAIDDVNITNTSPCVIQPSQAVSTSAVPLVTIVPAGVVPCKIKTFLFILVLHSYPTSQHIHISTHPHKKHTHANMNTRMHRCF